jgi:hypothetical protein
MPHLTQQCQIAGQDSQLLRQTGTRGPTQHKCYQLQRRIQPAGAPSISLYVFDRPSVNIRCPQPSVSHKNRRT